MRRFWVMALVAGLVAAAVAARSASDAHRTERSARPSPVAAATPRADLSAPGLFRISGVGPSSVALRWAAVEGADGYRVTRNGRQLMDVATTRLTDRSVSQATSYSYQVAALRSGAAGPVSIPAPITTRAGGDCTKYASTGGADSNPGTSARPFRSITRLVNSLSAGGVGCVTGSHAEDVTIRRGGTATAPVVLRSEPGTRAKIRGRMWIADGADHVAIQGLDLDGRNLDNGDLPSPTIEGDHVLLLGNDITNRRWAICVILGSIHGYGKAQNVVLDGNRIHDCGKRPANNHHHGVYLENAYGTRITNNVIIRSADRGIQLYPNAQRSLIARNVIDGNGEGIIFSGNHGYASSRNRVQDNVITYARLRYNIEYWWPDGNPVGTHNIAERNCVWGGADGNIIENPTGFRVRANIEVDPAYRNRRQGDFRPGSGSGCRQLLLGTAPLV